MTTLTSAQLDKIADCIFILRDRKTTRLKRPVTLQTFAFENAMDPIASDANLKDVGFGIIDFTGNKTSPNIRLVNGGEPFRIGSTAKIAMMLAAVQLRTDVRNILGLSPQIITTPAEFDALYANKALWKKGKAPASNKGDRIAAVPPQISKIFDFTKTKVDFAGPDPDTQHLPANHDKAPDKLGGSELAWDRDPPLSFSERFWLTGLISDNVAATTCISEIGVPYMKAVQRAYGLAEHPDGGMHLLTSAEYETIPATKKAPTDPPLPRKLTDPEMIDVDDKWLVKSTGRYDDKRSWVPGSAAALTAYMLALINDGLAIPNTPGATGVNACTTIRNNMADGGIHGIPSYLIGTTLHGIKSLANVTRQFNKIGILQHEIGAELEILSEFVYVETEEKTAPAAGHRNKMQYAIVVAGMRATDPGMGAIAKAHLLAEKVHKALRTL
jgi:hypothetical protein